MHPLPHHYTVSATLHHTGDLMLSSEGTRVIESAPPKEFDGPGNQWSPETLLTAAVADCFALSFRAIAQASKFSWTSLSVQTRGTLERVEGTMCFTHFHTHATLHIPGEADRERAAKLLEKAEAICIVANSLKSEQHLEIEVLAG